MQGLIVFVKDVFLPVEVYSLVKLVLERGRIMLPVDRIEGPGKEMQPGASFLGLWLDVQILKVVENRLALGDPEPFGRLYLP
jgi:hypothetical protein